MVTMVSEDMMGALISPPLHVCGLNMQSFDVEAARTSDSVFSHPGLVAKALIEAPAMNTEAAWYFKPQRIPPWKRLLRVWMAFIMGAVCGGGAFKPMDARLGAD